MPLRVDRLNHTPVPLDLDADMIETVEGMMCEAQLAAELGRTGRPVAWIRPDRHQQDVLSMVPPAGRYEAVQPIVVVTGTRSTARGWRQFDTWPGDAVLFVEAPSGDPAPRARWLRRRRPRRWPPAHDVEHPNLDSSATILAAAAADRVGTRLDDEALERLVRGTGGRPALADSILRASAGGMRPQLTELLDRTTGVNGLITACVAGTLAGLDPTHRSAVTLAAQLGYAHHSLSSLTVALDDIDRQPWWESLEGGWYRVAQPWRRALQAWPAGEGQRTRATRLIGELEQLDGQAEAVDVALRLNLLELAAQVLADWAAHPPSHGSGLVTRWLTELPTTEIARHPTLARLWAARRSEQPHQPDAAWQLIDAAEALIDGRTRQAEQLCAQVRFGPWESIDQRTVAEADRIRVAAKRVRSRRSTTNRVATMLWAAGVAAAVVGPAAVGRPRHDHGDSSPDLFLERACPQPVLARRSGPEPATPVAGHAAEDPRRAARTVVEARLLGPTEVAVNGRPVREWTGNLGRAILALLASAHPQPVSRDRLLATFWPDVPVKSARNRLNVAMHDLRADLAVHAPQPVVTYRDGCYSINLTVDLVTDVGHVADELRGVGKIEAAAPQLAISGLQRAFALHRGEFCQDCGYAEWALAERDRQRACRLEIAARLARLQLRSGDATACLETCQWLLTQDRCHEEAHQLIMRAHSRMGQHYLAMRQFERCRSELAAEFDMAPDPSTVELHDAIRRRQRV